MTLRGFRTLNDYTIFELTGDDARDWVNGQLTNDVRATKPGEVVYGLFVSSKGKIEADAYALDRGNDTFWLVVPVASIEALEARFEEQIIMEDVEVERLSSLRLVAVLGDAAPAEDTVHYISNRLQDGDQDWLVLEPALAEVTQALLSCGLKEVTQTEFESARLRNGKPAYDPDLSGGIYPQEAGLRERAVSFNKGCYLGQEVVCMLDTRGKVTRRLAILSSTGAIETGPILEGDRTVGKVTSTQQYEEGWVALGYVKTKLLEGDAPALTSGGATLRVKGLVGEPVGELSS